MSTSAKETVKETAPNTPNARRERVRELVESNSFQVFIMIVILVNSVVIGVQTMHLTGTFGNVLNFIDEICLGIFIIELALKFYVYRLSYFKDGWRVFDLLVIAISLIPTSILPVPATVARVVRLFRAVRAFKLVSIFKQMRIIVEGILKSIPGVAWTICLLLIVYYIFAVTGIELFGALFPEYFGGFQEAFFTLFQLTTMENWADIARTVMATYPASWIYFIPFVIIAGFIFVNVVVGIIVNTMEESKAELDRMGSVASEQDALDARVASGESGVEASADNRANVGADAVAGTKAKADADAGAQAGAGTGAGAKDAEATLAALTAEVHELKSELAHMCALLEQQTREK